PPPPGGRLPSPPQPGRGGDVPRRGREAVGPAHRAGSAVAAGPLRGRRGPLRQRETAAGGCRRPGPTDVGHGRGAMSGWDRVRPLPAPRLDDFTFLVSLGGDCGTGE